MASFDTLIPIFTLDTIKEAWMFTTRYKISFLVGVQLLCSSLLLCAADDQARILTPYKTWKVHDRAIERIATRASRNEVITMASNKQLRVWSESEDNHEIIDFSDACRNICLAIDNEEKVLCLPGAGRDLILSELGPEDIGVPKEAVLIHSNNEIHSIALWSQDGKTTIYAGDYDGRVSQWLVDWKQNITSSCKSVEIAPPACRINALLGGEQEVYIASTQGVHLWKNIWINKIISDQAWFLAQDDKHLYVGCLDGTINVYEKIARDSAFRLPRLHTLQHNTQAVAALLCQQGKLYASSKNAISVWNCKTLKQLAHAPVDKQQTSNRAPIAVMKNILYRGLSTGKVIAYNLSCLQETNDDEKESL